MTGMDQPWSGRKLHFVGVGGAGMSGLAVVAQALGASVTGSDRAAGSPYAATLAAAGIEPVLGHDAANVPEGAEVVYCRRSRRATPSARAPELHRADLLGEITRLKPTIAVSGTHGKTTTSSMLVHALAADSYLVGGEVRSTGSNAGWGPGEWLVVEADESDRSLLKLSPTIAVVTNAELDHHTTYPPRAMSTTRSAPFWPSRGNRWSRRSWCGWRSARRSSTTWTSACPCPGEHNARNAAAALTAIRLAGADVAAAAAGWRASRARAAASSGAASRERRRAGRRLRPPPDRVAATIAAARTLGPRRVLACFQPHLFSRTQREASAFGRALAAADLAVILDVYPARERAEDFPGVSGLLVAEATTTRAAESASSGPRPRDRRALPAQRKLQRRPDLDDGCGRCGLGGPGALIEGTAERVEALRR